MPNWCYNELTVSGETADLKAFATAVAGSAGPMDFQAVLPMPPILHNVARGTWPGDDAGSLCPAGMNAGALTTRFSSAAA